MNWENSYLSSNKKVVSFAAKIERKKKKVRENILSTNSKPLIEASEELKELEWRLDILR